MSDSFTQQLSDCFTLDELSSVMDNRIKYYGFAGYFLGNTPSNQQKVNDCLTQLQLEVTQFIASMADFIILGIEDKTANLLLSKREQECLMWMAKGRNNNDIAAILELSERTIKFHIKIEDAVLNLKQKGVTVFMIERQDQPKEMLRNIHLIPDLIPEKHLFSSIWSGVNVLDTIGGINLTQ